MKAFGLLVLCFFFCQNLWAQVRVSADDFGFEVKCLNELYEEGVFKCGRPYLAFKSDLVHKKYFLTLKTDFLSKDLNFGDASKNLDTNLSSVCEALGEGSSLSVHTDNHSLKSLEVYQINGLVTYTELNEVLIQEDLRSLDRATNIPVIKELHCQNLAWYQELI